VVSEDADGEGDGEGGFSSRPRPAWIEVLINKYASYESPSPQAAVGMSSMASDCSAIPGAIAAPPVGKFAAFLSCCVTLQIDCTRSEEVALIEVCH
jgi:hypothetical protein